MFGSNILEAAIGLFLVYFLFSVLCSALNEWIVGHFKRTRARTLETGILRLLGSRTAADAFFALPLIQSLSEKPTDKPSYISTRLFVDALVALLHNLPTTAKPDGAPEPTPTPIPVTAANAAQDLAALRQLLDAQPDPILRETLHSLLAPCTTLEQARHRLASWFDEGMDRASGWYRKHAQKWTLGIAAGVVICFNADSITIARELLSNSRLRNSLVVAAERTANDPRASALAYTGIAPNPEFGVVRDEIAALQLPIGWHWSKQIVDGVPNFNPVLRPGENWPMKFGGWLITIGAISLGAPFWFELMGRLINLRAAGRKPEPVSAAKAGGENSSPRSL